ncbi:MAG: hypothetical protein IH845_04525 [Nanoarchaeota archaeon]|nr:hypothetical protein [Nanoarchaeota archaeon]
MDLNYEIKTVHKGLTKSELEDLVDLVDCLDRLVEVKPEGISVEIIKASNEIQIYPKGRGKILSANLKKGSEAGYLGASENGSRMLIGIQEYHFFFNPRIR